MLVRLGRQALVEERRALAATDQAIAAQCDELAGVRAAAERERRAAGELAAGNLLLTAYLRRVAVRAQKLQAELRRLEHQREALAARLSERHRELKCLEVLVESRAERAHAERMRREQKAIDELVAARRHRRGLPTR